MDNVQLFPVEASTTAARVDLSFFIVSAVCAVFALLVFLLLGYFCVKYRNGSNADRTVATPKSGTDPRVGTLNSLPFELGWTIIPTLIGLGMFAQGAYFFEGMETPPANAMEIHVVGKQWMWKVQHPEGPREINELHVPVGRPVKLTLSSEDVIHDFFVPAFRIKCDVLPGRVVTEWFEATVTGQYHLFCSQYCGFDHAAMGGTVVVMTAPDYAAWLIKGASGPYPTEPSPGTTSLHATGSLAVERE